MGFISGLVKWSILAPLKLLKFVLADVLFGIIGGMLSAVKALLRFFFKPLVLVAVAGGAIAFLIADKEKRKKVLALIGM